jgi:hypothetical protein
MVEPTDVLDAPPANTADPSMLREHGPRKTAGFAI